MLIMTCRFSLTIEPIPACFLKGHLGSKHANKVQLLSETRILNGFSR